MTTETKAYIEEHISLIENNEIASVYLRCPLQILNDFNNSMYIAGIEYPPEINVYVVVCCYMSGRFTNIRLQSYDFEYSSEKEEFRFTCDNCLYLVEQINHDLSVLLPKRSIDVDIVSLWDPRGMIRLNVCVKVN